MDSPRISKPAPQMYVLEEPGESRAFRAKIDISVEDAFAFKRGERQPKSPVKCRWAMGDPRPGDVIWTTLGVPLLVSNRVTGILQAGGFKGWTVFPIDLAGADGQRIAGFHGLSIVGRCGAIENQRSIRVPKKYPGGVFPVWKGLYFDPSTWDGSDIFMPQGKVGWVFVAKGLRDALDSANVGNIDWTPIENVERSVL
jgi:uncharacterized protein DUF1629